MILKMRVLSEDCRVAKDVEYITVTALEESPTPLLQMLDYNLRREEVSHKGKLVGKVIEVQVENIRAIFSGRPQMSGRILNVAGSKA